MVLTFRTWVWYMWVFRWLDVHLYRLLIPTSSVNTLIKIGSSSALGYTSFLDMTCRVKFLVFVFHFYYLLQELVLFCLTLVLIFSLQYQEILKVLRANCLIQECLFLSFFKVNLHSCISKDVFYYLIILINSNQYQYFLLFVI